MSELSITLTRSLFFRGPFYGKILASNFLVLIVRREIEKKYVV